MSKVVRTRMAPSPTGEMHVGSMAILLKNYAYAKKHGGQFLLRIEDTDKTREIEGGVQMIQDIIHRYGLDWDEGPYLQSERLAIYQEKAKELVASGHAYYCFCSKERLAEVKEQQLAAKMPPHYDRCCRDLSSEQVQAKLNANEPYVIRLKVPDNREIVFNDLLRGEITFHSSLVDDQVLLKSDGYPTYHLAVVVDDHLMEITHIMRGEEWISSTPKHILLYEAFNWPLPVIAHIPVFLNPDGKGKMSKRKGAVSAASFLERGYLPEALLNFFMILGWSREDQEEIMTLDEYIQEFEPSDLSSNSVAFDMRKLDWMNGIYIRRLSVAELADRISPFVPASFPKDRLLEVLPLIQERLVTLADFATLTDFFFAEISYDASLLLKKAPSSELVSEQLELTIKALQNVTSWNDIEIETVVRQLQESHDWHKGQYFMMLRIAVTGQKATPPLFATMTVIGRDLVLSRLQQAQRNCVNSETST